MRCMYRCLPVRSHGLTGILQQTDHSGGGCNMSIEAKEEFRPKIVAFCCNSVSYTHLDVYKRQVQMRMNKEEVALLKKSADALKEVIAQIEL